MLQDQLNKATVKLDHLGSQSEIVLHKGEEPVRAPATYAPKYSTCTKPLAIGYPFVCIPTLSSTRIG
eukprot:scaffold204_cov166-Alexandrium_tamarense.AAC.7